MVETCAKLGEHGARVMIENNLTPHYEIYVDREKKEVTCWVESQAEKAFSVVWMELDVPFPSSCDLYLDGRLAESYFRRKADREPIEINYANMSESSAAPFKFGPSAVTDDDTYLDIAHSIGEIKLVISRTSESMPKKIRRKKFTFDVEPPHSDKIHERTKNLKGIAHRVNYGAEVPKLMENRSAMDLLETLVTFIFRYRPIKILRANGIVPRIPLPTSETEHSKVKKEGESGPDSDDSDSDSDEDNLRGTLKAIQVLGEFINKKIRKRKQLKDKRPQKKM